IFGAAPVRVAWNFPCSASTRGRRLPRRTWDGCFLSLSAVAGGARPIVAGCAVVGEQADDQDQCNDARRGSLAPCSNRRTFTGYYYAPQRAHASVQTRTPR